MEFIGTIAAVIAAFCGVIQLLSGCSLYVVKKTYSPKKVSGDITQLASIKLTIDLKYASETEYFTQISVYPKKSSPTIELEHLHKNSLNYRESATGPFTLEPLNCVSISFKFFEPFSPFVLIVFFNSKIWKSKLCVCRLNRPTQTKIQI